VSAARRSDRRLSPLALAGLLACAGLGPALPSQAGQATPTAEAIDLTPQRQTLPQIVATLRAAPAKGSADTEALARATAALGHAADLDFRQASKAMNEALQLDARNSYLHFFNGFIYHLQARQGDKDKADLAIEGYRQALHFDPSNWIAHEFLGLAMLEQKQYGRAQSEFAEVLLVRPDDTVTLARMLAASYMAGDAATACSMADRMAGLPEAVTGGFLKTSVSVYSACGEFEKAEASRNALAQAGSNPSDSKQAGQRIAQWQSFYRSRAGQVQAGGLVKTQFVPGNGAAQSDQGFQPGAAQPNQGFQPGVAQPNPGFQPGVVQANPGLQPAGGAGSPDGTRMVLVDVVMVRTEDSIATLRGVNLLSALTLQFGSAGAPAFSRETNSTLGAGGSTILTRAITVPSLLYSLNLANANTNLNEVLARPTLAAVEGMRSEFFSGTSLNAAVVSSGNSSGGSAVSVEKRYGVKLAVLPQILPNGMIKLSIDASRTFLKPPSANIGFTYKIEISEILANANVVMRMGDTLVLGGLSEKESTNTRDGVPVLQDVPVLQYLTSQQSRTDYQRSVLILITPRPAAYTWLTEDGKPAAAAQNGDGVGAASVDVLRARYSDWFKPYPNLASVFHHLNSADLYREFRTGDVTLERWDRMESTSERLKQALGFLYY
jgi:pilus assembly protein CpaC